MKFDAEVVDRSEYHVLMRLPSSHNSSTYREGHFQFTQSSKKSFGRRLAQEFFFMRLGPVQQSAIFSHYEVKKIEPVEDPVQVRKMPSGYQRQLPAGSLCALQSRQCACVHSALRCNRAIIIRCNQQESHSFVI